MNPIKLFFESKAFIISVVSVLIYSLLWHDVLIFNQVNVQHIFYLFLALLPMILTVFTILISFTDKDFLVFLRTIKEGKKTVYDSIIFFFILNAFITFVSLLLFGLVLCCDLSHIVYLQYLMLFVFVYAVVSFIQLMRFVFYFAQKKAEFVDKTK